MNGFVVLFLVNALTYLLYAAILVLSVREDARPAAIAGGYRVVLRDRPFVLLALTAAVSALALERQLPAEIRLTPRPEARAPMPAVRSSAPAAGVP